MYRVRRGEFGVNEVESNSQGQGEVAALSNGNYAVVYWEQGLNDATLQIRILDNNGQPILGTGPYAHEIIVSTSPGSGGSNSNGYIDPCSRRWHCSGRWPQQMR
jgi:hypothetical protein